MVPFAHAADWAAAAVYMAPVVGFMVWLGVTKVRERRRERAHRFQEGSDPLR